MKTRPEDYRVAYSYRQKCVLYNANSLTYPTMRALRRVLLSSSLLTKMEEERLRGRQPGAAKLEMS
jgi:hypothetical protein